MENKFPVLPTNKVYFTRDSSRKWGFTIYTVGKHCRLGFGNVTIMSLGINLFEPAFD